MSPRHNTSSYSEHSPWTEAFQTNPVHQVGDYDSVSPYADETLEPTWHALSTIYGSIDEDTL